MLNGPPPSVVRIICRFLRLLEDFPVGPPQAVDLTEAAVLPGWAITRDRSTGRNLYNVWLPHERDPRVPWTLNKPAPHTVSREGLWRMIADEWTSHPWVSLVVEQMREPTDDPAEPDPEPVFDVVPTSGWMMPAGDAE